MGNFHLEIWKEELCLQKNKKMMELMEVKRKIERLQDRPLFLQDIKEKLQSSILEKLEKEIQFLIEDQVRLKKEIADIDTILHSIEIEIGNIMLAQ